MAYGRHRDHPSALELIIIICRGDCIGISDVPWRQILRSFPLFTKALVWFTMSYMIYNATNNLPTYMERVHGLTGMKIGTIFGLVSILTLTVNLLVAWAADKMKNVMTNTSVRKVIAAGCSLIFVPSSLYIINLKCDTMTIILCISVYIMFASSVSS